MGISVEHVFNPDPTKQAQEVILSRNQSKKVHSMIYVNNDGPVAHTNC